MERRETIRMTKLDQLADLGQSLWLDYIHRDLIQSGKLKELIDLGVRGMTSNPSIFDKAIANSASYDDALAGLASQGKGVKEIYDALVVRDIRDACDLMRPVFDRSQGGDGFVSLEVDPELAHDTQGTLTDVRRYSKAVDRPNLLIKIPGTKEGIPAIRQAIGEGIKVNVTLMFSVSQYEAVADAYMGGLEDLDRQGGALDQIASVASFFVSRVDTNIDQKLDATGDRSIRGRIGIDNAKKAYARFRESVESERWQQLAQKGARVQRVLWASTSTKDPAYPDTMYVDELIGPDTVNTVPPETLDAYMDHGTLARSVDQDLDQVDADLRKLEELGIQLDQVTDELLKEGVVKFDKSYKNLISSIQSKCEKLQPDWQAR